MVARNSYVYNWESAKQWIEGGKTKVSRPVYDRYLSVRLINPDDPDSDISMNYRYRHIPLDPKARKPSYDTTPYAEILTVEEPTGNAWMDDHRKPILIYKKDNTVLLTAGHRYYSTRVLNDYAGAVAITKRKKRVKIRQPKDSIELPKRKVFCRACSGDKYIVFTCWDEGPMDDVQDLLDRTSTVLSCNPHSSYHKTHIAREACGRCGGTGQGKATFERWNSYVWDDDVDLVLDQTTKELRM